MSTITRRSFLSTTALTLAATRLRAQNRTPIQASLVIPAEATGPHMPADFVGLSYEVEQLADPSFFSAKNIGLIRAFRQISTHAVLRIGGNTGEFGWWKPTADSPEPEHPHTREVVGEPKASYYPVTPEAIRNLAAFLDAVGLDLSLRHQHGNQHSRARRRRSRICCQRRSARVCNTSRSAMKSICLAATCAIPKLGPRQLT